MFDDLRVAAIDFLKRLVTMIFVGEAQLMTVR